MFFGITKAKANAQLQRSFATRNFIKAITLYRKLIAKSPNDHELIHDLGVAYLESGALSEAVAAFHDANRLLPASRHYNNLGRALLALRDYDAAMAAFAKARELDPADPQPWYNLTVLLRDRGRREEAHQELRNFLQAHPTHANGLNDLGCWHLDRRETSDAIVCFEQAIANAPDAPPPRLNLIRVLCDAKRFPETTPHLDWLARQGNKVVVGTHNGEVQIDVNGTPLYRTDE